MSLKKLGIVAISSVMLVGAFTTSVSAAPPMALGVIPDAAYFLVNLAFCTPSTPTITTAGYRIAPTGEAAAAYEVLVASYGNDCEAFYAKEVMPRLDLSDDQS